MRWNNDSNQWLIESKENTSHLKSSKRLIHVDKFSTYIKFQIDDFVEIKGWDRVISRFNSFQPPIIHQRLSQRTTILYVIALFYKRKRVKRADVARLTKYQSPRIWVMRDVVTLLILVAVCIRNLKKRQSIAIHTNRIHPRPKHIHFLRGDRILTSNLPLRGNLYIMYQLTGMIQNFEIIF